MMACDILRDAVRLPSHQGQRGFDIKTATSAFFICSTVAKFPTTRVGPRCTKASGAKIAILRGLRCFSGPPDHQDDRNQSGYQCQCREDTFGIEQDK